MKNKRRLDLFLTVLGAVVWVPVVLTGALMVLLTTGRPIFYRSQRRVSPGRTIRVVKFRTMVKNAAEIANRETVPVGDTRFLNIPPSSPLYTGAGRVLERFAITELPQFAHVLRGEMSIVGNRPLPENVIDCLREEYPYVEDRFLTNTGLTGPTQLVGREVLTDEQRLMLEATYCRASLTSYSVRLDLAILIYTVLIVLKVKQGFDYQGVVDLIHRYTRTQPVAVADKTPAPVLVPAQERRRRVVRPRGIPVPSPRRSSAVPAVETSVQ